jgi:hypothetical protein
MPRIRPRSMLECGHAPDAARLFMMAGSLSASEPAAYPLWNGQESVVEYAKKVNVPATKTLDLGNGVNMELVFIPEGKFITERNL